MALTATASPSIRDDIMKSLHLVNPLVTCTSFDRPNLYLDVNRKSGDIIQDLKSFVVKKKGCAIALLINNLVNADFLNRTACNIICLWKSNFRGDYEFEGSAIVYCPSKKETERVTSALFKLGIRCGVYHAGLSIKQRRETQYQFMRDEIQVCLCFHLWQKNATASNLHHHVTPTLILASISASGKLSFSTTDNNLESQYKQKWQVTKQHLNF